MYHKYNNDKFSYKIHFSFTINIIIKYYKGAVINAGIKLLFICYYCDRLLRDP